MIPLPRRRPPPHKRTFYSALAEQKLEATLPLLTSQDARTLFENCWLNTLDTTVFFHDGDLLVADHVKARPESWIITGDIDAMWLRDSANQVAPYLSLLSTPSSSAKDWTALYRLLLGTIYTQADCILHHPFSNAFIPPTSTVTPGNTDRVHPPFPSSQPGQIRVHESKYELDSLASFLSLSMKLAEASGRVDFLHNRKWREAVKEVLRVCRLQQRGTDEESKLLDTPWWGPGLPPESVGAAGKDVYRFQRETRTASETRALSGLGEPAKRCGLIKSAFRPSDDATVYPFLIPSNAFVSVGLLGLADIISDSLATAGSDVLSLASDLEPLEQELRSLGEEVRDAIWEHAVVTVRNGQLEEKVFAYEVDGFGSHLIADDANLPSLLSIPWLGFVPASHPVYKATRQLLLSPRNKWWFAGKAGEGIGGMHIGEGFIWPMSLIARALTSDEDEEILDALHTLVKSSAGTGFLHESFERDDASNFTRAWFAWTNGLYGQLVLELLDTKPYLL